MKMIRKIVSICLTVLLVFGTAGSVFAENGTGETAEMTVQRIHLDINNPVCGNDPAEEPPMVFIDEDHYVTQEKPAFWIAGFSGDDPETAVPLQENIVGGEEYTAIVSIEALPGYCFDQDTRVLVYDYENGDEADDNYVLNNPVQRDSHRMTVVMRCIAGHDWDWAQESKTEPTCVSTGVENEVCKVDPSHTRTTVLEVDPDAHDWGEWTVTREATKGKEGERVHTCKLCGTEESEVIPRVTYPYTRVYEPDTSWPMAATIAWRADSQALKTVGEEIRPATAFVWLDGNLKVYDREGGLLSEDLESYVDATVSGMIPAFYIEDSQTAAALKEWISLNGLQDCFVVSTPEHKDLVKDVADLLHVRGMLDYTSVENPDRAALLEMIASVNGAHGKVVILSEKAATRENIHLMQSLAATVWVKAKADTRSLVTLYTNGVNGIVTDDYEAALNAEELFQDDAPSLLRLPLIIGHRGDPSSYVENTLDSARGAYEEGVDSVENDIQLSKDGELFILHDDYPDRFLGILEKDELGRNYPAEYYSLEQLRNHPFLWDDPNYGIIGLNEVPAASSRYGSLYGQEERKQYTVPTLREYIEAFKGTGLVHDTEIKSYNPDILKVYKEIVDSCDAWDQFFTITFNRDILDAAYREYPEISMGALGMGGLTEVHYADYDEIAAEQGPEAAVAALYGVIDQWNATYNPDLGYGEKMVKAGRHRGLTVWPWTYRSDFSVFADYVVKAYLNAVTGMTMDDPWTLSDEIVGIDSEDVTVSDESEIAKPQAVTRAGERKVLEDAELVLLENLDPSGSRQLMIWKYKTQLNVRGTDPADYYLYSNPFVMKKSSGSSGSGGSTTPAFNVTLPQTISNGSAVTSASRAKAGQRVTVTVNPEEGCQTEMVKVTDVEGNPVEVTDNGNGTYSFTMPASEVKVDPVFRKTGGSEDNVCPRDDSCPMTPFTDADKQAWYHDGVHWTIEKGVMNGTGDNTFEPLTATSRAMIVTMLWRMEGSPQVDDPVTFKDVADDQWYTDAVRWAAKNGIVKGYSESFFGTSDDVTREQIAAILFRYAEKKDYDVSKRGDLKKHIDSDEVSDWAEDALAWAIAEEMIVGYDDQTLAPGRKAARAELATVLMRFGTAILMNSNSL